VSGISVVVTYYNREQFIDEALQSVFEQTLQPDEILLVNDGSDEASRRYLDKYEGRVAIIDLPRNSGLSTARNEGCRRAKGEFIAFLDDDDIWLPEKLAAQRRHFEEHPEVAALQSGVILFFQDGREELAAMDKPSPLELWQALNQFRTVMPQTLMIRAEVFQALGGFDPAFRCNEEWDFQVRLVSAGYRLDAMRTALVRVRRQRQTSLTGNWFNILKGDVRHFWKHRSLYFRIYGWRSLVLQSASTLRRAGGDIRFLGRLTRIAATVLGGGWTGNTRPPASRGAKPARGAHGVAGERP
jgi:glycosyltransferase involved in cell wall biosynthesis